MTTLHMRKHSLRAKSAKENIPSIQIPSSDPSLEKPIPLIFDTTPQIPSSTMLPSAKAPDAGSFSGFLNVPLKTLRISLDDSTERITLHDLAETYNVIYSRLKEVILMGLDSLKGAKALEFIQLSNSFITKAILRDMNRLFTHPFSMDDCHIIDDMMDDEHMQYALDLTSVAHEAIRLLSQIVAFPAIQTLFSGKGLSCYSYAFLY
jgi:hypothetical protein